MIPPDWRGSDGGRIKTVQFFLNTKKSLSESKVASGKHIREDSDGLVFGTGGVTKHLIQQSHQWKEEKTVPKGWKVREFAISGINVGGYFMTPRGFRMWSD